MYAEISAAISSAKAALDIAKAAHSLSNFNELVAAVSEVNAKLLEATAVALASQEKQAALIEEVNAHKHTPICWVTFAACMPSITKLTGRSRPGARSWRKASSAASIAWRA